MKKNIYFFILLLILTTNHLLASTIVSPGDTGKLILPVKNVQSSVELMEEVRISITSPSYFHIDGSSLLGPVNISPNNSYSFELHYEISSNAPDGSFKISLEVKTDTNNCIPNPPGTWTAVHHLGIPFPSLSDDCVKMRFSKSSCSKRGFSDV